MFQNTITLTDSIEVPMIMFAFKVAPALICGNTVVLKSSEKAPLSSLKLAALIKECGFPPGVVNIISGFGLPTGSALALHMKVRKISFTGSVATGRKILTMAAESNLKNVSLELGGKSPAIIFEDADLDAAARYTHFAINHNSGQHCQANSRVLIHESIAEEYIKKLKVLISKFAWGMKNVPKSSAAYTEEIFGPVLIVNTFQNESQALAEANDVEFGLFCE